MNEDVLLYGFHAVASRLRHHPGSVVEVMLERGRADRRAQELLNQTDAAQVRVRLEDVKHLDTLAGHNKHQGVLAKVTPMPACHDVYEVLEKLSEPALLLVLDGVQDPHNLGACLRVADAMGAHAVIAPKDRAAGLNATVRKVASGAAETVPFVAVTNLARSLRELQSEGIWVIGTDGEAERDLRSLDVKVATAWVLGAEGEGLRRLTRETCDELVRIPMFGSVESLNVSVACGICLYETRRQRQGV